MEEKNLKLVFKTEAGAKTSMTLNDVNQDLQGEAVQTAMESMVESGAFATTKGDKYFSAVSASYVQQVATELFNSEA